MTSSHVVPRWVTAVTVTAVSVVAGVSAVVSYVHVRTLAEQAGEEWRATILPLSVDGLLVAASMVMLTRRREGQRVGVLPWLGLILGIGASLAANVAAGHPEWESPWLNAVVAAWPAVALAIAFELLILVLRGRSPADRGVREETREEVREEAPEFEGALGEPPGGGAPPMPDGPDPDDVRPYEAEMEKVTRLRANGAGWPTFQTQLGLTEYYAKEIRKPGISEEKVRELLSRARNGAAR